MNPYIYENINECLNAFETLLSTSQYISRKTYESYLNQYHDSFNLFYKKYIDIDTSLHQSLKRIIQDGYQMVEEHNAKYVSDKLIEYKSYFDNMFKGIDDDIILDEEQRKAIVIDEDYSLLIAGAGSGKTTTMSAKAKYLIDIKHIKHEQIVILAFTKKATAELESRINDDFKLNVEVLTFHKLGMKFIRKYFKDPISVAGPNTTYEILSNYVQKVIFPNKIKLKKFLNYFKDYVYFDNTVFNYTTFDKYFDFYAMNKFKNYESNLNDYITPRIQQRKKIFRTIKGEYLKSLGEVEIANYLYLNGYNYTYEEMYPQKLSDDRSYSPDFTLDIDGLKVYIEYYGLTTLKKDGTYTTQDIKSYNKLIEKKRILHKQYGTDLIELYCQNEDNENYLTVLEKALEERKLYKHQKTDKEVFECILYTTKEAEYFDFIKLMMNFIERFKQKGYSYPDFDELIEKERNEVTKYQLLFARESYRYYMNKLVKEHKVDFSDMINYASRTMEQVKSQHPYLEYEYVIIDEYQDISLQKYNMAKKLSDIFNAKIVAVGDDWQAIYSFSGSDVELFTDFYNLMGYAEILKITKTYRNSQELIDVASTFVSQNTSQFNKTLISSKHLNNPIEINYYNETIPNNKYDILNNILLRIYAKNPRSNVLLLGRYHNDIEEYFIKGSFKRGPGDKILSPIIPELNISFLTIHSSKGLGYDEVILINALNDIHGFPSKIEDEPLLKTIDITKEEIIDYPEERRLFYVALTRTKNRLYIICPYFPPDAKSNFVNEIRHYDNVFEKIEL